MNIYVTTASNAQENSWGTYCPGMEPSPPPEYITCLGDLYSVAWMEDRYEFWNCASKCHIRLWDRFTWRMMLGVLIFILNFEHHMAWHMSCHSIIGRHSKIVTWINIEKRRLPMKKRVGIKKLVTLLLPELCSFDLFFFYFCSETHNLKRETINQQYETVRSLTLKVSTSLLLLLF